MKIGIAGSLWINTPPKKYGGTEAVIASLADKLVEKGHEVTVFGPQTMNLSAKIVPTLDKPLFEKGIGFDNYASINYYLNHYLEVFRRANDFDVLHVHLNKNHDNIALILGLNSKTPVLFTLHYPAPTADYRPDKYLILNKFKYLPFTSISNAARSGNDWNFVKTVYNAIDIKQFPFSSASEDYFVWIGKAIPAKGLKEAIEVAKKANIRLKIMAAIDEDKPSSVKYFNELKPLMDGKQIIYMGEADMAMKTAVLGKAKAFINPLQWPEPFGLVMAESQAVGTPVIALNRGSAPELIVNGKTGFVVDTLDEMVEKIKDIGRIERDACRSHVEMMFSPEKMVEGYEQAYGQAIKGWKEYRAKQQVSLGFAD
jgi:glycosyltransferase involved in cell wall biosynthesis